MNTKEQIVHSLWASLNCLGYSREVNENIYTHGLHIVEDPCGNVMDKTIKVVPGTSYFSFIVSCGKEEVCYGTYRIGIAEDLFKFFRDVVFDLRKNIGPAKVVFLNKQFDVV